MSEKKVLIFGTGQFAQIIKRYLEEQGRVVAGFTVEERPTPPALELPRVNADFGDVFAFETIEEKFPPSEFEMIICVGYTQMNRIRQRIFSEAKQKGYNIISFIHETATVLTDDIGEGTIVMERALIGPFSKLGKGNIVFADAHIAHHTIVGDFNFFTISVAVAGSVKIGCNCFFGNNCTIRNGIEIRDYTLVGAGAYVSKNTEEYDVLVPTRAVKLEGKSSLDIIFR